MKLVGAIAFLDSMTKENRTTTVMPFDVASDWFQSVREFYRPMVMTGDYDGTEILVTMYEYKGKLGYYSPVDDFDFTGAVVHSMSIMNPYYT